MKVLIVGSGGREHALAWKVAQSPLVSQTYVAPGNAGTQLEDGVENVAVAADDIESLKEFALKHKIDLTIVGPELPLAAGIADQFQAGNLPVIGPVAEAALLESSKRFSKEFMRHHDIPTARYRSFTQAEAETALEYLNQCDFPIVIKADGLAAGKGVIIAQTKAEAVDVIRRMLSEKGLDAASKGIVIEDFLVGEELSFICLVDGEQILPLASSQDHKARDDGDSGPNTGGMGAYSPAPIADEQTAAVIVRDVIEPVVRGMKAQGVVYSGFLYAGLMVDNTGKPQVLEFNCRLGDPETQPILMRLKSDLVELCLLLLDKKLSSARIEWDERVALGVVMASGGYPGAYAKGELISGLKSVDDENVKVFHAGSEEREGRIFTSGGRVLCVTALADTVTEARTAAYRACSKIRWKGSFYRKDIGHRAMDDGAKH